MRPLYSEPVIEIFAVYDSEHFDVGPLGCNAVRTFSKELTTFNPKHGGRMFLRNCTINLRVQGVKTDKPNIDVLTIIYSIRLCEG